MLSHWEGGRQYFVNVVRAVADALAAADREVSLHLLCPSDTFADLQNRTRYPSLIHTPPARGGILQKHRDLRAFVARCDVVFPWQQLSSSAPAAQIAWIPDLQHKALPGFFPMYTRWKRDMMYWHMLRSADITVVSSCDAEQAVHTHFSGIRSDIAVVPFRSSVSINQEADAADVQRLYGLPDRFLLLSNQWWAHKNHRMVFAALRLLRDQGVHPVVVCTGDTSDYRSPATVAAALQEAEEFRSTGQVFVLGSIERQHQLQLMRRCIAVLQPSLFEGWNTSVEEARFLGKSIILSDIAVHREQDPPDAVFFDPSDAHALALHLRTVWASGMPGPDLQRERAAMLTYEQLRAAFGARLLDVFEQAHRMRALR